jgi:dTDP-4-dehydrorhamnose 3,5-epimerase
VFDVAVDVRPSSPTFGRWHGIELSADNGISFYIPHGFAHGFVTLCDETDVLYQMAEPFVAEAAAGFRWDDPTVAITWPLVPEIVSERDKALPSIEEAGLD